MEAPSDNNLPKELAVERKGDVRAVQPAEGDDERLPVPDQGPGPDAALHCADERRQKLPERGRRQWYFHVYLILCAALPTLPIFP